MELLIYGGLTLPRRIKKKTHPFSGLAKAIACILAAGGRKLVSCPRPLRAA